MRLHRTLLALALTVGAAPAGAAQITSNPVDDFVARTGSAPSPRRGCGPLREPRALPGLSALGDSAAFIAALREFSVAHPVRGDSVAYAVYSVTVGADGRVSAMRPIHYWLPSSEVDAFQRLVRGHLRGENLPPSTFRVRVRLGERPTVVSEYSERCPAEVRANFHMRTGTPAERRPQPRLRVRARVAADGRLVSVHVLRSSGDAELDSWVQGVLGSSSAIPALIDGEPVDADVETELRVRID